jgi:hypothetical protein
MHTIHKNKSRTNVLQNLLLLKTEKYPVIKINIPGPAFKYMIGIAHDFNSSSFPGSQNNKA